jgi:phage shock protein A
MSGLTGRIATFVKTETSTLLDQAEDSAETLDYAYERQLEDLQSVKQGIVNVVTAKKRLQLQGAALRQQTDRLDGQARQAMSGGREDLAHAALERKYLIAREVDSLDEQVAELEAEQHRLIDSEQQLGSKVEAFRSKKELIKAQYSAAEARVRISEAATGVGDAMADVGLAVQRVLGKTEDMKARASAVEGLQAAGTFEDLAVLGTSQDDIDRQLVVALDAKSAVEEEFAKLKAEAGPPGTHPAKPAWGDPSQATNNGAAS